MSFSSFLVKSVIFQDSTGLIVDAVGYNQIVVKFYQSLGRRVTQRDIADQVGVSHVTVSQVLHQQNGSRVSQETRDEILRAAREMGYQARGMTTHTVAMLVKPSSLSIDVTTSILVDADEVLRQHGFRMSVSMMDLDHLEDTAELFGPKKVDGVIFTEWSPGIAKICKSLSVPRLLLADATETSEDINQVGMDTVKTSRRMTARLIAQGHKHLCVVTGVAGVGYHERLKNGVRMAFADAGLPEKNISVLHTTQEYEVEDELISLLRNRRPPTAIITGSPSGANFTLNRLQANGFKVPGDVSLVSIIDNFKLGLLKPSVTSTNAAGSETVKCAVETLVESIRNPRAQTMRKLIAGEIIERDSVRAVA